MAEEDNKGTPQEPAKEPQAEPTGQEPVKSEPEKDSDPTQPEDLNIDIAVKAKDPNLDLDAEPTEPEAETPTFPEYEDPELAGVVDLFQSAGGTPEQLTEVFSEAVKSGDPSKIDQDKLKEILGETRAANVNTLINAFHTKHAAKSKEIADAVYESMGSKENWNKVLEWARKAKESSPELQQKFDELNVMLNQSPTAAVFAAQEAKKLYEAQPNHSSLEVQMTEGTNTVETDSTDYISRSDYNKALTKARREGNNKEVERLRKLRFDSINSENNQ